MDEAEEALKSLLDRERKDEFRAQMRQAFDDAPAILYYGAYRVFNSAAEWYVGMLGAFIKGRITRET